MLMMNTPAKPYDVVPSRDLGWDDMRLSERHGHAEPQDTPRPRLAVEDPTPVNWTGKPVPPGPVSPTWPHPPIPSHLLPYIRPEVLKHYESSFLPDTTSDTKQPPSDPKPDPYVPDPRLIEKLDSMISDKLREKSVSDAGKPATAGLIAPRDPYEPFPPIPPHLLPYLRPEFQEKYGYAVNASGFRPGVADARNPALLGYPAPRDPYDPYPPRPIQPPSWHPTRPQIREKYGYSVPTGDGGQLPYRADAMPTSINPYGADPRLVEKVDRIIDARLRMVDARTKRDADVRNSAVALGRDYGQLRPPSPSRRAPRTPLVGREITRNPQGLGMAGGPRPMSTWQEPEAAWRESYAPIGGARTWWEKPIRNDRAVGLEGQPIPREPRWVDPLTPRGPPFIPRDPGWIDPPPPTWAGQPPQTLGPNMRLTERGRQYRDSLFYPRIPLIEQ
ncbi:uncharacterized protein LOC135497648 [Lineus longissimus]|uniref:uncharacterized protein LOC135497648 n=1 Tax=Lineus longissimus TaxID=88925 RepID=UPI002B4FAC2C